MAQQWPSAGGDGPMLCHRWPDVYCVWTLWRVEILLYNGPTANGRLRYSVGLMLGHRLRRWPNINTTLHLHLVFSDLVFCVRDARDVWRRDAINKAWTTRFTNELPTTPSAEPNLNSIQKNTTSLLTHWTRSQRSKQSRHIKKLVVYILALKSFHIISWPFIFTIYWRNYSTKMKWIGL